MLSNTQLHQKIERTYKKARRNERRSTQHGHSPDDHESTPFRLAEKKYKVKFPPPDLSAVLDLALLDKERDEETKRSAWVGSATAQEYEEVGVCEGRKVYCLPQVPGTMFHKNKRNAHLINKAQGLSSCPAISLPINRKHWSVGVSVIMLKLQTRRIWIHTTTSPPKGSGVSIARASLQF